MKTKQKIIYWLSVSAIGIAVGVSLQFVKAWTEPTRPAPNGNIGAPINTGTIEQNKNGILGANIFQANGGKAEKTGDIAAKRFCLPGVNPMGGCIDTWPGGSGTSTHASGGLYGYCRMTYFFSGGLNVEDLFSPFISGSSCDCPGGYTRVQLSHEVILVLFAESPTNSTVAFACLKN